MTERYWAADDQSKLQEPHHGWYEVLTLDGKPPKPPEMPRYKAESAFAAARQAGLTLAEARVTAITCPECIYELDGGDPDDHGPHTCEEE